MNLGAYYEVKNNFLMKYKFKYTTHSRASRVMFGNRKSHVVAPHNIILKQVLKIKKS